MATINQLTTSNTFLQWLSATQSLITHHNNFKEGESGTFRANTSMQIDGDLAVTGNVNLDAAGFDNLTMNGNLILAQTDTGPFFSDANTSGSVAARWSIEGASSVGYSFDSYHGANPSIKVKPGQTYAFDLQKLAGAHPFVVRTESTAGTVSDTSTYYNVGLTHVEKSGNSIVISKGADAQGKNNGILYWKVPANTIGSTLYYQCTAHASAMVGNIEVENTVKAAFNAANTVVDESIAIAIALG